MIFKSCHALKGHGNELLHKYKKKQSRTPGIRQGELKETTLRSGNRSTTTTLPKNDTAKKLDNSRTKTP